LRANKTYLVATSKAGSKGIPTRDMAIPCKAVSDSSL
jgi:hypothetical protein